MQHSKKREVALMLSDPSEEATLTEILEKTNTSENLFLKWVSNGTFKEELRKSVDMYAEMEYANIFKALIKKCRSGDLSAIKLFMELKGKKPEEVQDKDFNISVNIVE